jgi:hypothetical protein
VALLGWAGGLRDDMAVGDIVIADRALSAGRSDVACLALPLAEPGAPTLERAHRGPVLTAATSSLRRQPGVPPRRAVRWPWKWKPTRWQPGLRSAECLLCTAA